VVHDGTSRIQWYIQHRQEREAQVLAAVAGGAGTVAEIAVAVYPRNLRNNLREAAARNVRTHLEKLLAEGRVAEHSAIYSLKGDPRAPSSSGD
jgi:predicted Rossmann-fold nucleotide-binding protein